MSREPMDPKGFHADSYMTGHEAGVKRGEWNAEKLKNQVAILEEKLRDKTASEDDRVLIRLDTCSECDARMIDLTREDLKKGNTLLGRLIPKYGPHALEVQAVEKGWVFSSSVSTHKGPVCHRCAKLDIASFECIICEKVKKEDRRHESYGDDRVVCLDCYETIPAKEWDKKIERLEEAWRYDCM